MINNPKLTGGCLCGGVTYEVDALGTMQFCHCRTCQINHGAPYIAAAAVKREHFHLTQGEDLLTRYRSSPDKDRVFCSRCGSPLFADRFSNPHIALRVTTLHQDPGSRPVQHIWLQDDCPWTTDDPTLPRYPGWPTVS